MSKHLGPIPARKYISGSSYVIDPSTIRWGRNKEKKEADESLFRAISYDLIQLVRDKGGRPLNTLSLPGGSWRWEGKLERAFPDAVFTFRGMERDAIVHGRLLAATRRKCQRFGVTPEPVSVQEYARLTRRKFDIVYYDWMGTWSTEKVADVVTTLNNEILRPGGLLVMTVSLGRGQPGTRAKLERYPRKLPCAFVDLRGQTCHADNVKVCGIPQLVRDLSRSHGQLLTPVMLEVYYSRTRQSNHTQPQLRITMRRDK